MHSITANGKTYEVDMEGFLLDYDQWDEDFARATASGVGIHDGLTLDHWKVINYIRDAYRDEGKCPLVYQTCRANSLHLHALQKLFPTGYLRGACKLAGMTYREGFLNASWLKAPQAQKPEVEKVYRTDVRGFLVDAGEWDERFAVFKAGELKMPDGLTGRHWDIITFLRESYARDSKVPTVYETCDAFGLELDEFEALFPDGYHRGAVKIAGLRVR